MTTWEKWRPTSIMWQISLSLCDVMIPPWTMSWNMAELNLMSSVTNNGKISKGAWLHCIVPWHSTMRAQIHLTHSVLTVFPKRSFDVTTVQSCMYVAYPSGCSIHTSVLTKFKQALHAWLVFGRCLVRFLARKRVLLTNIVIVFLSKRRPIPPPSPFKMLLPLFICRASVELSSHQSYWNVPMLPCVSDTLQIATDEMALWRS
jgi:hypothetical protein